MKKLLCFLGFHKWEYNEDKTKRWCANCGYAQELECGIFWGEPDDWDHN